MARRPDFRIERVMSREDLDTLARSLAHMSEPAVREFYQKAHREATIINGKTFPAACTM